MSAHLAWDMAIFQSRLNADGVILNIDEGNLLWCFASKLGPHPNVMFGVVACKPKYAAWVLGVSSSQDCNHVDIEMLDGYNRCQIFFT